MNATTMNAAGSPAPFELPPIGARARTALRALAVLARDPGRLDQVLVLVQAVNLGKVVRVLERITRDPEGARLLAERPRIDRTHVDFPALRRLPDGTLGREYARFLDDNGITPDVFEALPEVGDERIAWIMLRMRQTHDLWHVVTGYAPDVPGEIVLQSFTFAQTGAPSALLLTVFGTLRWAPAKRGHLRAVARAYRRGKSARFLPPFRWEEHWAVPLAALRERLSLAEGDAVR